MLTVEKRIEIKNVDVKGPFLPMEVARFEPLTVLLPGG